MTVESRTAWYVVCDVCGDTDGDSRPTEDEARERGWSWEFESNPKKHACDVCQLGGPR